jgi:signal transduction histidine kinase
VLAKTTQSFNDLVHAAIDTVGPIAEKYGVRLLEDLEPTLGELSVDEVKIRQVIVNLLSNAIKFSPRGGSVDVRSRREGTSVLVEVRDQGPGVRPEDRARIFELFGQGAQKGANQRGGSGIGLHLVRRIVELHGGQVGLDLPAEGGSLFWVRFPAEGHAQASQDVMTTVAPAAA